MRIKVISLPFDKERRFKIEKDFIANDLEFTFSDAIYGKEIPKEIKESLPLESFLKRKDKKPTDGEIGCTFSHINVYKSFLQSSDEWICILEDDAIIDKEFKNFIQSLDYSSLKPGTLYILGGQDGLNNRHKVVRAISGNRYIGQQKFYRIVAGEQYVFRTCCYMLHRTTAQKMISEFQESFYLADEWAYFKRKGVIDDIFLASFIHHPLDLSDSWIEKERIVKYSDAKIDVEISFLKKIKLLLKNKYTTQIKKHLTMAFWNVRNYLVALSKYHF